MKASSTLGTAAAALLLALTAQAECTFPRAPDAMPDGKTASEVEMAEATKAFKAYNEKVTAFGTCLDEETKVKSASSVQLVQLKTLQKKKHNAAVGELQTAAKQFYEQVRIFKGRS
jgi:hypothetical protein